MLRLVARDLVEPQPKKHKKTEAEKTEEQKERELKKLRGEVNRRAVDAFIQKMEKGKLPKAVLLQVAVEADQMGRAGERRGWDDKSDVDALLGKMTADQLLAFVVEATLWQYLDLEFDNGYSETVKTMAKEFGVDLKGLEKKVAQEYRDAAKAPKAPKPAPEKKPGKGKGK